MKSHEIYDVQDQIDGLNRVGAYLEMDGYYSEAREVIIAADKMADLLERLRSDAANDA